MCSARLACQVKTCECFGGKVIEVPLHEYFCLLEQRNQTDKRRKQTSLILLWLSAPANKTKYYKNYNYNNYDCDQGNLPRAAYSWDNLHSRTINSTARGIEAHNSNWITRMHYSHVLNSCTNWIRVHFSVRNFSLIARHTPNINSANRGNTSNYTTCSLSMCCR